jgi:hypothetical protein
MYKTDTAGQNASTGANGHSHTDETPDDGETVEAEFEEETAGRN